MTKQRRPWRINFGRSNRKLGSSHVVSWGFRLQKNFLLGADSVVVRCQPGLTKGAQMHRDRVVEFAALSLLVVLVAALYAGIFF